MIPKVNVGQMMIVLIAHADVEHRESFFVSNGVKLLKDDGVFVRSGCSSIISAIFMVYSPECCAGLPAECHWR